MFSRLALVLSNRHAQASAGFTFIEALVVVVLLGIVSAYIAPKAISPDPLTLRAQARNLTAHLQYAQWMAITTGTAVTFCAKSDTYVITPSTNLAPAGTCPSDLSTIPATNETVRTTLRSPASLASQTVLLDSQGIPQANATASIVMSLSPAVSGQSFTLKIDGTTGFVSMVQP